MVPYLWVFDTDFDILDTIIIQEFMSGLASFIFGCASFITYTLHLDITSEVFANLNPGYQASRLLIVNQCHQ